MNHDESDVLFSLAQIAVAFAGFSAIVVLFGRGASGRWRQSHADRFHGMVLHAMVAVLGFDHEFRPYLVGVVWHVGMSGLLFVRLIWIPNADVDSE